MSVRPALAMSGDVHRRLHFHLFPGDGAEAAAILLCSRVSPDDPKLFVKDVLLVPHEDCVRSSDHLVWPGEWLEEALDRAELCDLSLILLHSHPGGLYGFSKADDASDRLVMPSLFLARSVPAEGEMLHGSAIMVPDGSIRARFYDQRLKAITFALVAVYGDDIRFFWGSDATPTPRPMAFGEAMTLELRKLRFVVVGSSGTGSMVVQQLARMGAGDLTLIDYDKMEARNLNRILGSMTKDVEDGARKVSVLKRDIEGFSPAQVHAVPQSVSSREAVLAASRADIIFCCVDSDEGRCICDRMAEAFLQPLFDVGVVIPVRSTTTGDKAILDVLGRIDYVQPGGSSLQDRGVYSPKSLAAEDLARTDPDAFATRVNEGYMPGSMEQAPSVISLNMRAASQCVQEFIARAYPYRLDGNRMRARTTFSLAAGEEEFHSEDEFSIESKGLFGSGLQAPLLGMPALDDPQ